MRQETEAHHQLKKQCTELQQSLNELHATSSQEKQKWQEIEKEAASKEKATEDKLLLMTNEKQDLLEQTTKLSEQMT